jgi:hypothetical protein
MNSKAKRPRLNSQSLILPTRTLRRRNLVVIRRKELHQTAKNPHRRIRIGKRKYLLLPKGITVTEMRGPE